jgi:hypothetical protein
MKIKLSRIGAWLRKLFTSSRSTHDEGRPADALPEKGEIFSTDPLVLFDRSMEEKRAEVVRNTIYDAEIDRLKVRYAALVKEKNLAPPDVRSGFVYLDEPCSKAAYLLAAGTTEFMVEYMKRYAFSACGAGVRNLIVELNQQVVVPTFFPDNPLLVIQLSYYECTPRPEGESK